MLLTETYTVASEPLPSGELDVRDPSPAEAERAIAENTVDPHGRVSQLNSERYVSLTHLMPPPHVSRIKPVPKLTPEQLADIEACRPSQEAADALFAQYPVPTGEPDYVMVPSFELVDPEENRRRREEFAASEANQRLLDTVTNRLMGWEPGPFPGTVMRREPGVGTAIFPDDPAYIARVLRGTL